jgi:hypothetical protein
MVRTGFAAAAVLLAVAAAASAQSAPRHRWQTGQTLVYNAEHVTQAVDAVGDTRVETKSSVKLTKRWQVVAVDPSGVATLQMSLATLRIEQTMPGGGVLLFDSSAPDKSDPEMRKQLGQFVGQPLAVLRLDPTGKLVEVKESKFGPPSRFENELPFAVVLPPVMPQAGQGWERVYKVTLDPPQGTGEKFDAVQRYTCKGATAEALTVTLTTELKAPPQAVKDRIPLLQVLPEGEVVFDVRAGRMRSASLRIDKELKGHQGEDSSYHFTSVYTEQYAGDK